MSFSGKIILLVEDEKPIALALQKALTTAGFEVKTVFDGREALTELSKDYDLMVMDLVMPNVDGFEVLKWVNTHKPAQKVIVTSNLGQQEDMEKAKQLGVKEYLVKANVSLAQIVDRVKYWVGIK